MAGRFTSRHQALGKSKRTWLCEKCGNVSRVALKKCCGQKPLYFQSTDEAKRYGVLKTLERVGQIKDLKTQPVYPIIVNGRKCSAYKADFIYTDKNGAKIIEDVKPNTKFGITDVFKLKRKLVEAIYGITITLVNN